MRMLIVLCLLTIVGGVSPAVAADAPSYLLLQTSGAAAPQPPHSRYPGYGFGVQTQAYSYGWFGAQPRRHWSRHFGTYRNFTEWSAK